MHFLPGIDALLTRHRHWLEGKRIGLVSHLAAVDARGMTSAERLWRDRTLTLRALFGPEHGFFGLGDAGQKLWHRRHPDWGLPVYSLYGSARRPTPAMFKNLDVLVVDLQDLGARCYTYVATLRYVLEQAAAMGKEVVVADRPIPLPRIVDGPMLAPAFESFVAGVRAPMHYGMTPGEMALWLKADLGLDVSLRIARMQGYARAAARGADWPPWIPPSPGIRAWEAGQCYLATVFSEALPAINNGRSSNLAFQVFAAPWLKSAAVCERLNARRLPGVSFYAHPYSPGRSTLAVAQRCGGARSAEHGTVFDGVRLAVTNPNIFHPVYTGISILACLQELYGIRKVWKHADTREDFFDKLYGTDAVRRALQAGAAPEQIRRTWGKSRRAFVQSRAAAMLY
ncbi:MAG: DUF1343 domain-containing protein [Verrucomicrobia bacterium]|nr:DUF1343 domain-containing protein [Verrucomicrobiota bacterium]MBU1735654.1 DUF1343 domain-containing protein [Verrucomicrobiota bacterium]MBU1856682.1 DUF1343 domain-containing protein [Verrucomicrobiota bacterium]